MKQTVTILTYFIYVKIIQRFNQNNQFKIIQKDIQKTCTRPNIYQSFNLKSYDFMQ